MTVKMSKLNIVLVAVAAAALTGDMMKLH